MNHLERLRGLKNRYFVLRHGESMANILGIIISNPHEGIEKFGLSEKGKIQVREAAIRSKVLGNKTIIYSSDFLRTKETAEIFKEVLKLDTLILDERLRERNFGQFDNKEDKSYEKVWCKDKFDPNCKEEGVESAQEVLSRTTELVLEIERTYSGEKILLVSHGDALQILQTGFLKICPSKHRAVPHLNTAEVRELKFT